MSVEPGHLARCGKCGAAVRADAKFCLACGSAMPGAARTSPCGVCGHVNPGDSSFCRDCGAALVGAQAAAREVGDVHAGEGALRGAPGKPLSQGSPPGSARGARIAPLTAAVLGGMLLVILGGGAALLLSGHGDSTPGSRAASASAAGQGGPIAADARVFHAPEGNVTCEVESRSARCAVRSNDQTFVLPVGGAGYSEAGMALTAGAGPLADYGASVSVGSVSCRVPAESEPRGIVCADAQTGHGFEASKVASRQKLY